MDVYVASTTQTSAILSPFASAGRGARVGGRSRCARVIVRVDTYQPLLTPTSARRRAWIAPGGGDTATLHAQRQSSSTRGTTIELPGCAQLLRPGCTAVGGCRGTLRSRAPRPCAARRPWPRARAASIGALEARQRFVVRVDDEVRGRQDLELVLRDAAPMDAADAPPPVATACMRRARRRTGLVLEDGRADGLLFALAHLRRRPSCRRRRSVGVLLGG